MATYLELRAQIEKLEAMASEQRGKELKEAVAEIKAKIKAFGLSAFDLGFRTAGRQPKKEPAKNETTGKAAKKKRKPAKAKYRHPETGATWTGRGRSPAWLAEAEANGKKRESFLID